MQVGGSVTLSANRTIAISSTATATLDTNRSRLEIDGVISGSGGLAVVGSGELVLTNAETFSGDTTIAAGTLQVGSDGATGGLSGNIVNDGTLVFSRSDSSASYSGEISGSGSLTIFGNGTLVLSGSDDYLGGTSVITGTLLVASGTALPEGTSLSVGAGAALFFSPAVPGAEVDGGTVAAQINPVPEPGSLALFIATGLLLRFGIRRKRLRMMCGLK